MNSLKRRFLTTVLLILAVLTVRADAIGDFTESAAINAPQAAVLVIDLKTGKEIAAHNADKSLIPASIMKCVTTATLLREVGNRYCYETPVYYTGRVTDGVLGGDIIVKGSGDPSVNTRNEPGSADLTTEIVEALRTMNVQAVSGRIVIDESDFPGPAINPTWQSGDLPHAYGTGTHGFNFEDNAAGKKSVKDPGEMFRTRLRGALLQAGIALGDRAPEKKDIDDWGEHLLLTHRSERIDDIMRSCMMRSDNQFAEGFMRKIGLDYGGSGSTATGTKETMKHWQRRHARMDGVRIVDGSGLSRSNRVTARFMGDVLRQMAGDAYYASFFPLAGQEGTLKKFLAGTKLEGEIALKTGSMNGIQCYAGYKLNEDYAPTHVVVVILNEMKDRAAARSEVEKLLLAIF